MEDRINGSTMLYGLIGNPVEHSCSPQLHNTLNRLLGINAVYIPMKTEKKDLGSVINGLKAAGFQGLNITIPFKEEVLKYVGSLSPEVERMGSANVISFKDGKAIAGNTDGAGFLRSFQREVEMGSNSTLGNQRRHGQSNVAFKNKKVAIIGSGGAAVAIAFAIAKESPRRISISNRTIEKAKALAARISATAAATAATIPQLIAVELNSQEEKELLEHSDVIINTTPLGMHPWQDVSPLNENVLLKESQIVCDIIYSPAETKLLKYAKKFGCKTMNGAGMLFYQGVLAYEQWMDIKIPQSTEEKVYNDFIAYIEK
jgi:shikimate dehydrogenase